MEITILCKVVDNFGDIGVAWRLTKHLRKINSQDSINLIVDDLISFSKIDDSINPLSEFQKVLDINIYDWKKYDLCYKTFSENDGEKLSVILELFQCGRPDWMEKILFEDKLQRTVNVIMIDYLTAEKYADDFHCLESLTRSKKVQKVNFMPGFTSKTGGLVIDEEWQNVEKRNPNGQILVFTYERDWTELIRGINDSKSSVKEVFVAQGRGFDSFVQSYKKISESKITLKELPYLNQPEWDKMMKGCSALVIRGEESMSRACLSGIPFVWHAYPQSDEYQLVKVQALLDRMAIYFDSKDFEIVQRIWMAFNKPENEVSENDFYSACLDFFNNINNLEYGFIAFAEDLRKNGDLCSNLMTYIKKICIIK